MGFSSPAPLIVKLRDAITSFQEDLHATLKTKTGSTQASVFITATMFTLTTPRKMSSLILYFPPIRWANAFLVNVNHLNLNRLNTRLLNSSLSNSKPMNPDHPSLNHPITRRREDRDTSSESTPRARTYHGTHQRKNRDATKIELEEKKIWDIGIETEDRMYPSEDLPNKKYRAWDDWPSWLELPGIKD